MRVFGYSWELTDLRVLLTLFRSVLRDLTVPRCVATSFLSCLSVFFCCFNARRSASSRRLTVLSIFCAAATLLAAWVPPGCVSPPLRLAVFGREVLDRVAGRDSLDVLSLDVGVRRVAFFFRALLLFRAEVAVLVAM